MQKRKAIKDKDAVEAKIAKLEDASEIKEEIDENKNAEIDESASKDDIELDQNEGGEIWIKFQPFFL